MINQILKYQINFKDFFKCNIEDDYDDIKKLFTMLNILLPIAMIYLVCNVIYCANSIRCKNLRRQISKKHKHRNLLRISSTQGLSTVPSKYVLITSRQSRYVDIRKKKRDENILIKKITSEAVHLMGDVPVERVLKILNQQKQIMQQ